VTVMKLLNLENVRVSYGDVEVIREVSLFVEEGTITSLVGSNGAGKTSLLQAVSGIIPCKKGKIYFDGKDIAALPAHQRVGLGLIQVPEGRHVFPYMSVLENLELGSTLPKARSKRKESLGRVFDLFPRLLERSRQMARTLSGGEQQMLAIGRALMSDPRLLMLDEPSLGLAPKVVKEIFSVLAKINAAGVTVLVVEQDVKASLELGQWGYVLENGRIVLSGEAGEVLKSDRVRKAYLGL
jgi:branched-chain amino acid transport system ATP-binding protein